MESHISVTFNKETRAGPHRSPPFYHSVLKIVTRNIITVKTLASTKYGKTDEVP